MLANDRSTLLAVDILHSWLFLCGSTLFQRQFNTGNINDLPRLAFQLDTMLPLTGIQWQFNTCHIKSVGLPIPDPNSVLLPFPRDYLFISIGTSVTTSRVW
jgi:hypothetical protein